MNLYSYPAGSIINGIPTTERTVRQALPVVIDEIGYSSDIFANWSKEELLGIGIKTFIEEQVPDHYIPGAEVDTETEFEIQRTYPNKVLDTESWKSELTNRIQLKKIQKRDGGFLVDGVLFDSDAAANVQYLNYFTQVSVNPSYVISNWKASDGVWVEMNATLFAKVSVAFSLNTQAAFDWQATMLAKLASVENTYEALKALEEEIQNA